MAAEGARRGRGPSLALAAVGAAMLMLDVAADSPPADLRLNDIQLLGSHNSYKQPMPPERMAALRQENPELADALDYSHLPLEEQLELGIRKLEIDVFYDPDGHLFERHRVAGGGTSDFPVMHVQNLDDRSHCMNLMECLSQLNEWSETHPGHLPIFLSFNAKDDAIDRPGFVTPKPFDEAAWTAFDAELTGVLGDKLITPDQVFRHRSLVWPALDDARGKFLTILDEGGRKRDEYARLWHDRVMFANLPEQAEGAAVLIVNDPLADMQRIRELVRAGYIVRTRADADTREARSGSIERRDAAFASGAQLVSTDYYLPADELGTGYQVIMPGGGVGRCNPVRVPEPCVLEAVDARGPPR